MDTIISTLYLLLPGAVANSMPIVVRPYFTSLAIPIDGRRVFRGKRIFGDHKTVRGYVFGILGAIIVVLGQAVLMRVEAFENISLLDYSEQPLLIGFLIGFGVLAGDSVKSFFKRQRGIAPGVSWKPWDQLDSVIGGVVALSFTHVLPWQVYVLIALLGFLLHIATRRIGYWIGVNKTQW
ncbi:MAG: CDP-archaeol synthase [Candidatus Kerfeldbacteria bacterium]|nr:CDP-archaeol synthase [Candidatus Kerfeldbacteria bacterium]